MSVYFCSNVMDQFAFVIVYLNLKALGNCQGHIKYNKEHILHIYYASLYVLMS